MLLGSATLTSTSTFKRWLTQSNNRAILWARLAHSTGSPSPINPKSKAQSKPNTNDFIPRGNNTIPKVYSPVRYSSHKVNVGSKKNIKPNKKYKGINSTTTQPNNFIIESSESTSNDNVTDLKDWRRMSRPRFPNEVKLKGNINRIIDEVAEEGKKQQIKTKVQILKSQEDTIDKMKRLLPIQTHQNLINRTISVKDDTVETFFPLDVDKIPKLHHNLDRALFSPGVHFLQDPRTRIFNFSPFLKNIINYNEFNFDSIANFQPVSKHVELLKMAKLSHSQFYSSTSSMTSSLMQFYYLLNNFSNRNFKDIDGIPMNGLMSKLPASLIITPQGKLSDDNSNDSSDEDDDKFVYSVSSDKSCDTEILLSAMGNCLEVLLTSDEQEFQKFTKSYQEANPDVKDVQPENVYNYAKYGSFLMRSQMDCYDERLPRGSFDIKTRAACAIRYDSNNRVGSATVEGAPEYEEKKDSHYQIWKLNGEYESFEREFKDLIRSGSLLKYLFQARIGQMDGIYVAYHNIQSFFGFQYLPLEELDELFYGKIGCNPPNFVKNLTFKEKRDNLIDQDQLHSVLDTTGDINLLELNDNLASYIGDSQFKMSMKIWEDLLQTVIKDLKIMKQTKLEKQAKRGMKIIDKHKEDKVNSFRLVMQAQYHKTYGKVRLSVSVVEMLPSQIRKLDEIPQLFKTSFKDTELTNEERDMNLNYHKHHLQKFNESTVRGKKVLSYVIDINNQVINGEVRDVNTYKEEEPPQKEHIQQIKLEDDWRIHYSISKRPNDTPDQIQTNRANYLRMLSIATDSIINSPELNQSQSDRKPPPQSNKNSSKKVSLTKENILKAYSKIGESRAKKWHEKDSQRLVYKPK